MSAINGVLDERLCLKEVLWESERYGRFDR